MAGLLRKALFLFAGSASNNGVFGSAQAGTKILSNDTDVIQGISGGAPSTPWVQGWNDAVVSGNNLPTLEEMQALQYVQGYQLCYLLTRGLAEYNSITTYNTGDITRPAGSTQLYKSLIDANTGNALPSAITNSNWQYLGDLSGLANPANNLYTGGTTTGSANAQLIATTSPAASSYSNGQMVSCTAGFTNTGSMTFGAGGETPIIVKKDSGSGLVALTGGEVVLNDAIVFTKNTAGSCWVLTSGLPFGSAAFLNAGTSANNVVQLNGSSQLPAVSGALLTGITATSASSLASPGYVTLNNGLILQWGVTANYSSDSGQAITFPIAFPTGFLTGQATINVSTASSAQDCWAQVFSPSTSGMTVYCQVAPGGSPTWPVTALWFVIGH